ncbi:uncharacterized protein LOC110922724 [Helianthus annuus]|uniref:uncharacterized protein LOC110922724 n=2 Tax=Helianthus annuus TaxID=4232 RepID=UPI000B8F2F2E|nr:uncharacterized protein LOC110922724 [Helianthus annuus]
MKSRHEERSLNDGGLEGVFNKEAEVEQTMKSRHEERSLNDDKNKDGGLEGDNASKIVDGNEGDDGENEVAENDQPEQGTTETLLNEMVIRLQETEEQHLKDQLEVNPIEGENENKIQSILDTFPFLQVPITQESTESHTTPEQTKEKRIIKPTSAYKSPYVNRKVELGTKLSDDEQLIVDYIFSPADELKFVYKSVYGTDSIKVVFEAMFDGIKITSVLIDNWAEVLNNEEKMKSRYSLSRFFCSSLLLLKAHYAPTTTDEVRLLMFTQNLDQWLEQFKVKSIRDFDLLFFPILASEHYYVLCFNLKTSKIVLIDNSKMGKKFHDRYQGIPNMLRNALCDYLELKKIRFAKKTLRKAIIKRLEMPWRTEENYIDCGIYTMRHMETYFGEENWDCGFLSNEKFHKPQISELRKKFLTKMLLSEINTMKDDLIKHALEYEKMDDKVKAEHQKDLKEKMDQRQKDFV